MNSWKVILATIVIFGAGVVTGGLLVNHTSHFHPHENNSRPAPPELPVPRGFERGKQFIQALNDKLQLTPEQKSKIEKIVADGQERIHAFWQTNAAPPMRKIIQEVNQQIRAQLTSEQQKQFEELLKHPPRKPNSTNAPPAPSATAQ